MLVLLVSFYTSQTAFTLLSQLAELKRTYDILFVVIASVAAGAFIPELFLILLFQGGRPNLRNFRNLLFTYRLGPRRNTCRPFVPKPSGLVWRRCDIAGRRRENLRGSVWL